MNASNTSTDTAVFSAPVVPGSHGVLPQGNSAKPVAALPGKIMIVDDEIANVLVVKKYLERAGYRDFETTTDSTSAFRILETSMPDVLLLDINMPNVDGIQVLERVRQDPRFKHLPVLILTANTDERIKLVCLELGATDFLLKPVDPMDLTPRVRNSLQSKSFQDRLQHHAAELELKVEQRTRELEASRREVIYCLARAAEMRDNDTGNHVIRVGRFAGIIAAGMGLPDWFVRDIEMAAQLHDVGKIAIPDAILLKPGKLEPEEFDVIQNHVKFGHQIIQPHTSTDARRMRTHVELGADMLSNGSALMRLAASIAQTHHEKFDGSGYPLGLAGSDIPLEGRITAVADVFDALSAERPYKKAMPREKCFSILEEGRGSHFDPDVLDAFFDCTKEIVRVQLDYMDHCEPTPAPTTAAAVTNQDES
ncbi:HD domain-containing phosphohydrolase [Rhodopirellula europaea]|jgi:putative two-component system response regulator|uniref:Response regulator receiver modulated metal dependent phosphohydrolase n=1 Tax=Rhodopirellula europaea 6C TaxID=1263867 RepID=M2AQT8_9BACT|nr:HD domain-containing phosphohydrolase [Rhodopirellula europaea]EMB15082.1 response regulator receiver modulated metal dependent phosphohydrolase [Rhodopirellula europaea 6C]